MADWLTPEAVAAFLDVSYGQGAETDERIDLSTAAAKAAVERRRADLDFTEAATVPADVSYGGILWAAQMFQARSAPSGYSGYGDETQLYDSMGARRAEIMRLLGWRRPVIG